MTNLSKRHISILNQCIEHLPNYPQLDMSTYNRCICGLANDCLSEDDASFMQDPSNFVESLFQPPQWLKRGAEYTYEDVKHALETYRDTGAPLWPELLDYPPN